MVIFLFQMDKVQFSCNGNFRDGCVFTNMDVGCYRLSAPCTFVIPANSEVEISTGVIFKYPKTYKPSLQLDAGIRPSIEDFTFRVESGKEIVLTLITKNIAVPLNSREVLFNIYFFKSMSFKKVVKRLQR